MAVTRIGHCVDDDYPTVDWNRHSSMADLWLEVDERLKAGRPIADLLGRINYRLHLNRRWPRVDCIAMEPGLAVSSRAKVTLETLKIPGMQFLEFRVNGAPFFNFYTDRRVDYLDRQRSEIEFFQSSPDRVMQVVRYAFVEERLPPCDVFTVPELSDGMFFWSQEMFFTELARTVFDEAGLVGFRFEELPS